MVNTSNRIVLDASNHKDTPQGFCGSGKEMAA